MGTGAWPRRISAGDAWGGAASMLVALTSSIAFGVAVFALLGPEYVGAGALAGMLGAIALGIVAPSVGGTQRLITAPCAPAMAVMAAFVTERLAAHAEDATGSGAGGIVLLMTLVGLMAGGLQILYGTLGGGRFIKYIPYPVVAGYLSGVGVVIILGQVPKFLGLPVDMGTWDGLVNPSSWRIVGVVVGVVTMVVMATVGRFTKAVPAAILGLLAGVVTYFAWSLGDASLRTLDGNALVINRIFDGEASFVASLSVRWKSLGAIRWDDVVGLVTPAVTLSVLLSIDTLKTCIVVDALTKSRHNSNRELIGQGTANLVSAIVGGMPGAGTMGPTLVNINSGAQTRMSGILEGVFSLVAVLVLGSFISWIPIAALAGVLMVVGFRMIDRHAADLLKHRSTILDFVVILTVVTVAVGFNLIAASGTGLALAILLFIREQAGGTVIRRLRHGDAVSSKQKRGAEERKVLAEHPDRITLCELQGSLFFGTTDELFTKLESDLRTTGTVILDMRRVQALDLTAIHMLEQMEGILTEKGGWLAFAHFPTNLPTGLDPVKYFNQVGLVSRERNVRVFDTLDEALEWAEDRTLDEFGAPHGPSAPPLALEDFELFHGIEASVLDVLRPCVREVSIPEGKPVFHTGDEGREMYMIRRGRIRILLPLKDGRQHHLATFARGVMFGEIAFLKGTPRTADAVALTDVDLFVISRERFDEVAREHAGLGSVVFETLALELASRLRRTVAEVRILEDV